MVDNDKMEKLAKMVDLLEYPTNEMERLQYREKFFVLCDEFKVFPSQYEEWMFNKWGLWFCSPKERIKKHG